MTISATPRVAGPFAGDGITTTFPFLFKVFAKEDLEAATLTIASGAIVELVLDSDFSATLNADQDADPGGSITLLAGGLAVGLEMSITTDMPEEQNVNLLNGGGFFPDVINGALDWLTILVQQLQVAFNRCIRTPFPDPGNMELPSPAIRAGKLLGFDAAGNLTLVTIAGGGGGGIIPGGQTATPAVDGKVTAFSFTAPAGTAPDILVFAGGVFQDALTDYGAPIFVSGTTWRITFTTAPANGPVKILMLG